MGNSDDVRTAADEAFDDLIVEYHERSDRGEITDVGSFIAEHPDYRGQLEKYFADVAVVERLAGPPSPNSAEGTVITSDTQNASLDQTFLTGGIPQKSTLGQAEAPALQSFGRYQILQELGRGAMGAVYLAKDEQLHREVALKIPQFDQNADAGLLERFYREARAAAALQHPGICPVFDVGEIDGQHYITMAYIKGRPLRDFTKSSKRQEGKQVARVIRKIAQAMAEAHEHNVIHRDLKPANVMMNMKNEPVVMDFGLARSSSEGEERLTHTGTIIGTPAYMSPEQVSGDNDAVGAASDIYSLGVIFYELLTGQLPFQGNLMAILHQVATKEPTPPTELHGDVDLSLQDLCLRMLAKKPADRPESMQQVADELTAWLSGRRITSEQTIETQRSESSSPQGEQQTASHTQPLPESAGLPAIVTDASVTVTSRGRRPSRETSPPAGGNAAPIPPWKNPKVLLAALGGIAVLLAGITFFVRLGKHDVQITLDDPSITLSVDDKAVNIQNGETTIRLSDGPHQLRVEMDGFETFTDSFTVKNDGKTVVHVVKLDGDRKFAITMGGATAGDAPGVAATAKPPAGTLTAAGEPPPGATAGSPSSANGLDLPGERAAAAWVLSVGGTVHLQKPDGKPLPLVNGELPQEPFTVGKISIVSKEAVRDDDLACLSRCQRLQSIQFYGTSLNGTGLQNLLPSAASLTHLDLGFQGGPPFTTLTDQGLASIARLTQLQDLILTNNVAITDDCIDHLQTLDQLQTLDLITCEKITDEGVRQVLRQHPDLRELSIACLGAAIKTLAPLADGKNLEKINLSGHHVTSESNKVLSQLPKLRHLFMMWPTDAAVAKLDLPGLKVLEVFSPMVDKPVLSDAGIRTVSTWSGLESFIYEATAGSPENSSLEHLTKLPKLKRFVLKCSDQFKPRRYTSAGIEKFRQLRPDVELIVDGETYPATQPSGATAGLPSSANAPPPAVAPFDEKQAKAHQQAWADYLGLPVEKEIELPGGEKMAFVLIPAGEFLMGSTEEERAWAAEESKSKNLAEFTLKWIESEGPQHAVRITRPFYLAKHETTQGQWQSVMNANPSKYKSGSDYPVHDVSWHDAQTFLTKVKESPGHQGFDLVLPTEAQWEFACRAGTTTRWFSGDNEADLEAYANVNVNRQFRVGTKRPNAWGLYDMHGGMSEWCHDDLGKYVSAASIDPEGSPESRTRVLRGGQVAVPAVQLRSAARHPEQPDVGHFTTGFRAAMTIDTAKLKTAPGAIAGSPVIAKTPPSAIAPFDETQAKAHQQAWADHLGVPVETTNSVGQKMILIPPGEFLMGSTDEQVEAALKVAEEIFIRDDVKGRIKTAERPQHNVVITMPLLMSATEVTIGQFKQFAAAAGYQTEAEKAEAAAKATPSTVEAGQPPPKSIQTYLNPGYVVSDDLPAAFITWNDALAYCKWLSEQEKSTYRLPTEAEWEYACRAGTTTQYSFGDDYKELSKYGWHSMNAGEKSHRVGTRLPNPFGLFDMHGNLSEWCGDYYDEKWYSASPPNDPSGPSVGSSRVIRGGYWFDRASNCRSTYRHSVTPLYHRSNLGFRCVSEFDVVQAVATSVAPSVVSPPPKPTPVGPQPPPAIAPFDATQAKAHQEAWADYLGVPVEYENSIGMKFRLIPPGEFMMGSTPVEIEAALKVAGKDEPWRHRIQSEGPQHKVILTQPFYVGVSEVTQTQYEQVMETNPSYFSATGEGKDLVANLKTSNHPVETVSWNDAAEFCAKLSQQEQLKPFYFRSGETVTPLDGTGYRLPTEAEWESACRAGTTTRFWSGDEDQDLISAGWFAANSSDRTHAAGELKSNPFGLSDMHGNVWEWVQDSWDSAFYGKSNDNTTTDPSSPFPAGSQRVLRGGNWFYFPSFCRSSTRYADHTEFRYCDIGFRVVLPFDAVRESMAAPGATAGLPDSANTPPPAVAPFDAAQAQAHQKAWADYLGVPVEKEVELAGGVKAAFVLVPPGEFTMGSTLNEQAYFKQQAVADGTDWAVGDVEAEGHVARVRISRPFYLGKYEVTQEQWKSVTGNSPSAFRGESLPVEQVNWLEAGDFIRSLNKNSKSEGGSFRLPTEAEWEYACRAGTSSYWSTGEDAPAVTASGWILSNADGKTHPVGKLAPNPFGLHDMLGNIWEWCDDWYGSDYEGAEIVVDPRRPSAGAQRVTRGGSINRGLIQCRSAARSGDSEDTRRDDLGFRLALTIDAPKRESVPGTTSSAEGIRR